MRRRLPVVAAFAALLLGLVAVDRVDPARRPAALDAATPDLQPTAADPLAQNGSWFCPGGPTDRVDQGDTTLALANHGADPTSARVTAIPSTGANKEPAVRTVTVPGRSSTTVRLSELLGGAVPAAATVVAGPAVVVQQLLKAPEGLVVGPCATAASEHWYTAAGSTAAGTSHFLSLFNPFPGDAIADLAFSTDQGRTVPTDLQGVLVPGRSLVVIDVGDRVRRREEVAAEVAVRTGRLVVGRSYRKGSASSVSLGAPAADSTWYLPAGTRADGVTNRLVIANPSDGEADVSVEVRLQDAGDQPLEPLTLTVPPQSRATLNLDDEKIPKGVPYGLVVRSGDDVPIVVERSVETKTGRSDVLGSRVASRSWVSVVGGARGSDGLAVLDAGEGETVVTVTVLDGSGRPVAGPEVRIAPGGRGSFRLPDDVKGHALKIEADQPLVVERTSGDNGPTAGGVIAVPLSRA